ncbi:MAG: SDR family oxidoreductase [Proteobacteria bacterium]|nr:SDR family oxidoreductase [Pseudomonadota bacterium]
MDKKRIIITGAASGIGRETAVLFAKNNWYVGLFDVNEAGLNHLASEIGSADCFIQVMDVTDPDSVRQAINAFVEQTGGKLDVLLNNAGILTFGMFDQVSLTDHLRTVDVNFKGCLNCIYHSIPYLKKTPGSRIINMSSASSIYGTPDLAVYSATKHALSAMTEALNIELEQSGIYVCDIRPPYVTTPLLDSPHEITSVKRMGANIGPETVAKAVWKAAHNKKLHWNISITWAVNFFSHIMPFSVRFVTKLLTMPSPKKIMKGINQ